MAPVVAVTFVWQIMLNPELGIINAIGADLFGWDERIPFLEQQTGTISIFGLDLGVPTALIVVILYQARRYFPFSFLFILARLQALPGELDEAARVDGVTPLQRFWRITLPQLQGVIALLTVLRFIWTFNEFDDIYLLTQGGAGTEVVSVRVFHYLTGGQGFLVFLRNSAVISVSSVVVTLGCRSSAPTPSPASSSSAAARSTTCSWSRTARTGRCRWACPSSPGRSRSPRPP